VPDPYKVIGWVWEAVLVIWVAASLTNKRTIRRQSIGSRLLQLGLGVLAGLFIWGGGPWKMFAGPMIPRSPAMGSIALALISAGLAFAVWARFVIGRNWSGTVTLKQDHELVRSGPYAIVRHPIYTGFLFALLGTAVARGTIGAFIGVAIAVLALRLKSLTEESLMLQQFDSQYAAYKREVKALIPFVW
jgi:protein-S-isoprenylcysteine O-methyltransferase Ste14